MTHGFRGNAANQNDPILSTIVTGLLAEGLVPAGAILDAGSNDGWEACTYAQLAPNRTVHTLDPLYSNYRWVSAMYKALSNLRVYHAVLGNVSADAAILTQAWRSVYNARAPAGKGVDSAQLAVVGEPGTHTGSPPRSIAGRGGVEVSARRRREFFRMYRVDELFFERGLGLGFAHFDVEMGEMAVVQGAASTLLRDRSVFTTEVHLDLDRGYGRRLLEEIRRLGYDSYAFDERCGARHDCRNLLNLPRNVRNWWESPTLAAHRAKLVDVAELIQ